MINAPIASATTPALATAIPATCGVVSFLTGSVAETDVCEAADAEDVKEVGERWGEEMIVVWLDDRLARLGVPLAVSMLVGRLVRLLVIGTVELMAEVLVAVAVLPMMPVEVGATKTILGDDEATIKVAVIVACVLGKAFVSAAHILYALCTTSCPLSVPVQKLRLSSDMRHWTAPSPMV